MPFTIWKASQEAIAMLRRLWIKILLVSLFFGTLIPHPPSHFANAANRDIPSQVEYSAALRGQVKHEGSDNPVPEALISIPALDLTLTSDEEGVFELQNIPLKGELTPITVIITAGGFGEWKLQDVPLVAGDTLILTPKLTTPPYNSVVLPPGSEQGEGIDDQRMELDSLAVAPPLPATLPLPELIRVRVSGSPYTCSTTRPYSVQVIDFRQYVKNVLPNEWGALWPAESLRAGASAVRLYAWYMIARGGKWKDADVWDSTCDQVYNPNFEFASTSAAVDYIWDQVLSQKGNLFPAYYRAHFYQCEDADLVGNCMGQWDSKDLADSGYTWDQILLSFYNDTQLAKVTAAASNGYSLRFNGFATDYRENRVMLPVDDPNTVISGPPVDVGADSFTIEWWIKADSLGNSAPGITCGVNNLWVKGNILLDRSIAGLARSFGASIAGGVIVFGVKNDSQAQRTICSTTRITDDRWHHIAVQRQFPNGMLSIFVDGRLEATADGPDGDLSYPDSHVPDLEIDPFLGLGAWKDENNLSIYPYFFGWIDELRVSKGIRYTLNFKPPAGPFTSDSTTLALYHFDEGIGDLLTDRSGATGGPSHGSRETGSPSLGGDPLKGTEWARSDLFQWLFIPLASR
jgi:hypothetical protein